MKNNEQVIYVRDKELLREKYIVFRNNLSEDKVKEVSSRITNMFFSLEAIKEKQNFLLYHSFGNEIITYDIINVILRENKNVYLPYISNKKIEISQIYSKKELKSGAFGIMEPLDRQDINVNKMDVLVVPGLLFDRKGYRIGYGGGYYDRLLAGIDSHILTIGLAYDDFLQESLPIDKYDIPVKLIISEKQILYIGGV